MLARELGRTHAELMYGSAAFRPLSARERTWWQALYSVEAAEHEKAMENRR